MERKEASLIQSAVPASRGPLRHYEHTNQTAFTRFVNDKAEEIHTPQNTLKRIHEVMHARHTNPKSYSGIRREVAEIVEDCRLHLKHWPWEYNTPQPIKADVIETIDAELKIKASGYADFGTKLRARAVYSGMGVGFGSIPPFAPSDAVFAGQVLQLIRSGEEELAAKLIEKVFFDTKEEDGDEWAEDDDGEFDLDIEDEDAEYKRSGGKTKVFGKVDQRPEKKKPPTELERRFLGGSKMEVIELEKIEPTQSADAGYRLATSGARLYRPALRRPILSPRLFLKKAPYEPIGVICFDASSSMSVTKAILTDCCLRAPTAVVGYYQGRDGYGDGWLWVFARDGMRARETPLRESGNAVDGPAMDWMLTFDGPRIMVTDRDFCGSADAGAQKARLARLEREDQIKVYPSYLAFQKAFPRLTA